MTDFLDGPSPAPRLMRQKLVGKGWFTSPGAYVLVDGQFGSTGKGLLAAFLASVSPSTITHVTTNAGPNSGHTAYFDNNDACMSDGQARNSSMTKIVTQQVPVMSVFLEKMGYYGANTLINAGAVIDDVKLATEVSEWLDSRRVFVHPNAALITDADRLQDQITLNKIAGTGKGIGPAIANKVLRHTALAGDFYAPTLPDGDRTWDNFWDWSRDVVFVETAQGFSLGLNSARFYPHTTSRECTVMQAIADARIPAQKVRKVAMSLRTYPIRVGNTFPEGSPGIASSSGYSGRGYPDQTELTWEEIGVEPELTTVTKRVRRVFSWSRIQFKEAVAANRPDLLFLNFCNYMDRATLLDLIQWIDDDYQEVMGRPVESVLLGFGPFFTDIRDYIEDA